MELTMDDFGTNGRLANQLFQYASLIGIANKNKFDLKLPKWIYSDFFTGNFPIKENSHRSSDLILKEYQFNYFDYRLYNDNYNVKGYLQSEKYWEHCKDLVKDQLSFKKEFANNILNKFHEINGEVFNKPTIAIHIRRGDYVNNPNYYQLPITYYILALEKEFPNWENDYNIIIFSDDIDYCKIHFHCMFNVYFSEGNYDIEDLCLMSCCDNFILSNTSYSWWGSYLSNNKGKTIRPNRLFDSDLLIKNDDKDFWIKDWIEYDVKENKIDLKDTTFTIPVNIEHYDRLENLYLNIQILQKYFNTIIIVMEQNSSKAEELLDTKIFCNAYFKSNDKEFHRTKMLNEMTLLSKTPYIANWDCDIIIPPLQILQAVKNLRKRIDIVYPYSGKFARMERNHWYYSLHKYLDIGIVGNFPLKGTGRKDAYSKGGAVFFNKESFIKGGMENEHFISFGAEDEERFVRFTKLGFKVQRIIGALYHMDHFIGVNSSTKNPYFKTNEEEYQKVKKMTKEQLLEYIKTWNWLI